MVFEHIAKLIAERGFERMGEQCQDKTKKLKGDYRKIRDENKKTGAARKSWKFLEALDPVLGCKPATIPPLD